MSNRSPRDQPCDEWRIAIEAGANVLLQGSERSAMRALTSVPLRSPVQILSPGAAFTLPARGIRTVVLHHVEGLGIEEQAQLLRWMEELSASERAQIVSVSCTPLHALVEFNGFPETLYYRLNTILIEADTDA